MSATKELSQIATHTRHEVSEVSEGLAEDHVTVLRNALLELLLEIAAAVLVLAQSRNLALQIFQTRSREAIDCIKWNQNERS